MVHISLVSELARARGAGRTALCSIRPPEYHSGPAPGDADTGPGSQDQLYRYGTPVFSITFEYSLKMLTTFAARGLMEASSSQNSLESSTT